MKNYNFKKCVIDSALFSVTHTLVIVVFVYTLAISRYILVSEYLRKYSHYYLYFVYMSFGFNERMDNTLM